MSSTSTTTLSVIQQLRKEKNLASSSRIGWERASIGFDKEEAYLQLMLRNCVIGDVETGRKRSTSVIVYGIPGSGKTQLVENVLTRLDRGDSPFHRARLIVRLNGILCPDFKAAVEEICCQLKVEVPFEDEDEEVNEETEDLTCLEELGKATNFDDRLDQVMDFLRTNMESLNKSIIFVLDKLDLFAEHPNQHLLYNLYDLAANSKSTIPICIIGVTDRVDVLELFEKRVKSRFSHRNINVCPNYDFDKYMEITARLISFVKRPTLIGATEKKEKYPVLSPEKRLWNNGVDCLLKNIELQRILRLVYDTDPTILKLSSFLFSVLILVQDELTINHFQQAFEECIRKDDPVKVVLDLPINEVVVLLSIYKKVQNKTFEAWQPSNLYKIVEKIMTSFSLGKDDYLKSIAKLEVLQLIVPVSNAQRNIGGVNNVGEIYYKCELTYSEFQDIWKSYPQLPSSFKEFL